VICPFRQGDFYRRLFINRGAGRRRVTVQSAANFSEADSATIGRLRGRALGDKLPAPDNRDSANTLVPNHRRRRAVRQYSTARTAALIEPDPKRSSDPFSSA